MFRLLFVFALIFGCFAVSPRALLSSPRARRLKKTTQMTDYQSKVKEIIGGHKVVVFGKSYCPYCKKAKEALSNIHVDFHNMDLDKMDDGDKYQDALFALTGRKTVPNVFIHGTSIGGGDDTVAKVASGEVAKLLKV